MKRILVIEDNEDLAFGLRNNLELEGYDVHAAGDGRAGLEALRTSGADLVILDLMLPEMDGFNVLKEIRRSGSKVPVLILTARGEEADKVTGLRLGADDYVTKPFGLMELLARVEALLRRAEVRGERGSGSGELGPDGFRSGEGRPGQSRARGRAADERGAGAHESGDSRYGSNAIVQFGEIEVNPATRTVTRDGAAVDLSPKEFDLLVTLIRHDGAVVSREDLLEEVWGYASDVVSRTVDTHVAELRRKLEEDPAMPRHILTARKAGYRLAR